MRVSERSIYLEINTDFSLDSKNFVLILNESEQVRGTIYSLPVNTSAARVLW